MVCFKFNLKAQKVSRVTPKGRSIVIIHIHDLQFAHNPTPQTSGFELHGIHMTSDKDILRVLNPDLKLLDISPDHYENGVPVFTPSYTEFEDFYLFQKSIDKYGMQSGIVKIIPPSQWKEELTSLDLYTPEKLNENIKFRKPINQVINNSDTKGFYSIDNIERNRTYGVKDWLKMSKESKFSIPYKRGDPIPKRQSKAELAMEMETAYNIDTSIYTDEKCEFLENQYWKNISFTNSFYAADSLGSIFQDSDIPWNVSRLPNYLNFLKQDLPGVNNSYLYGGLWKSAFTWHLEDQDLYSINYIHFGAPKQWYSIPQDDHMKFYRLMSESFPQDYKNCTEFLRHKTFLVSPKVIEQNGIRLNKIVHREGEFIITYPFGYHSGYNLGYNVAESVNFALDSWIPIGLKAKKCECISDSVGIDIYSLSASIYQRQLELGLIKEEEEKEEDIVKEEEKGKVLGAPVTTGLVHEDDESTVSPASTISRDSTISPISSRANSPSAKDSSSNVSSDKKRKFDEVDDVDRDDKLITSETTASMMMHGNHYWRP